MRSIIQLINELESNIQRQEIINLEVSKSCVGWHIEHSLLTINVIIDALKRSNPNDYKWTFSYLRILIFTINKIPRGRAQSPASVRPKKDFNVDTLKDHICISKEKISELDSLEPNQYFVHPVFKKLNVKPAIKFIEMHTEHHLGIINDILTR